MRLRDFFRRPKKAPAKRNYAGSNKSRLTFDWIAGNLSVDSELRRSLKTLRYRCRELERNNDYMRSFLNLVATNVVGDKGFTLQTRIQNPGGAPDQFANDEVSKAWDEWTKLGTCTMDGRHSFRDVLRMAIRSIARDGETLVQRVRGPTVDNRFGYAIQPFEADYLDEDDIRNLNGNVVKMGVEVSSWNRPVAYHVWQAHPGDNMMIAHSGYQKMRIPSENMLHPFIAERFGQTRGLPWVVSGMTRLHMLGGYEEAELVAARVAASKMGFYESPAGDAGPYDEKDANTGELISEAAPGEFEQLPHGTTFKAFDPTHPTDAFDDFVKAMVRGVATSLGLTYPTLAGDLEGVNYSSLRQGAISERDSWRVIQAWLIETIVQPIFEDWLLMSLTTGALPLSSQRFDKYNNVHWQARGWQWVDPQKEAAANIAAMNAGLKSRTEILAERGRTLEDFIKELERERAMLGALAGSEAALLDFDDDDGDDNADQDED